MKLRNIIIGSVVVGGIGLSIIGGAAYQYVSKLDKQLDTYVLPHTTFDGVSLDGKTKKEVQQVIQQRIDKLNAQAVSYSLQDNTTTVTWKDLGVEYKGADIADKLFKDQAGNTFERYKLRKQASTGKLKREYSLKPYLNTAKYDEVMKDKYNDFLTNPQNASIKVNGTNIEITPSVDGEKVDKEKLKSLTAQAILTNNLNVPVPVVAVKPERTTENVQNMGIKEVIAEYRTSMGGRDSSQVFNVSRATGSLSGVFIAPDEVFSFNNRVGITDAANGYKSAAVYVNGKVEQSAGGGVCQVSSTLYGAVLRADLSIVERSNHSAPVHYVPLGQDATVADYGPDLKFKNNTGHYIYIQSFVEGNQATVRIFGTNTGKSVQVSSEVVGETDKNITVSTFKTVTQNGQVIQNGRISKSVYKKSA
ncbi:VanW family protein [Microbacteriaceae bacterium 4G12]